MHFDAPDPVSLCIGETLGRLELAPGSGLVVGQVDIREAFYRMELPEVLPPFFSMDYVTAAEVFESEETTSAEFVIDPDKRPTDEHARRYDPPSGRRRTFQEVSVLVAVSSSAVSFT